MNTKGIYNIIKFDAQYNENQTKNSDKFNTFYGAQLKKNFTLIWKSNFIII